MAKRVDLVDVAKGMSILLVAFHHSQVAHIYTDVTHAMGLFRMPLFFFLSGVFFSAVAAPRDFIAHKTEALLKPYFVTLGILLLTTILLGREGALKEALGILYGTGYTIRWIPMWFLTHLWALFMVSYLLVRMLRLDSRYGWFQLIFCAGLILLGVLSLDLIRDRSVTLFGHAYPLPGLPFSVDFICLSMAFFLAGHFLSQRVKAFVPSPWVMAVMGAAFFSVVLFTQAYTDLNTRSYREPLMATLAAFAGIYLMLSCAYYFSRVSRIRAFFKAFGSASLFILIFHYALGAKMQGLLDRLFSSEWLLITGTASYLFSVTMPLLIKRLIERNRYLRRLYFPVRRTRAEAVSQTRVVGG
ncbi:MAG: acyltransferase family protein [Candidatus Thiodiazotropha sp.]